MMMDKNTEHSVLEHVPSCRETVQVTVSLQLLSTMRRNKELSQNQPTLTETDSS